MIRAMDPSCTFCRIVAGSHDADAVESTDDTLAFLDHRPLFPGHTLVVPREHHVTIGDLPTDAVAPLFEAVRRVARAVEEAMGAQGTFVAMNNRVSQSVPHLHVHVVPRTKGDGLKGFFWPRLGYRDQAQLDATREAIAAVLARQREGEAGAPADGRLPGL